MPYKPKIWPPLRSWKECDHVSMSTWECRIVSMHCQGSASRDLHRRRRLAWGTSTRTSDPPACQSNWRSRSLFFRDVFCHIVYCAIAYSNTVFNVRCPPSPPLTGQEAREHKTRDCLRAPPRSSLSPLSPKPETPKPLLTVLPLTATLTLTVPPQGSQ